MLTVEISLAAKKDEASEKSCMVSETKTLQNSILDVFLFLQISKLHTHPSSQILLMPNRSQPACGRVG